MITFTRSRSVLLFDQLFYFTTPHTPTPHTPFRHHLQTFMADPIILESFEDINFDHGEALKFSVLRARTMFYMGQSENKNDAISFDDFILCCISGGVERHIPQMVIGELSVTPPTPPHPLRFFL